MCSSPFILTFYFGIICKTEHQAEQLFKYLREDKPRKISLLTSQSQRFHEGVVVCSAHMAKGLEFDRVIVPQVTKKNYQTPVDRGMLYVACTRAMHQLTLTHTGASSELLP